MSIQIDEIRLATPAEWDSLWGASDNATYFHSREWAQLWNTYTEGSIQPKAELIVFSDGTEVLLPISAARMLKGLALGHLLSPGGTYGGWLSRQPLQSSHAKAITEYLLKKDNLTWRWNPLDSSIPVDGRDDFTHSLTLSAGFESLFGQWSKSHKRSTNKAQREGVRISIADSLEEWQAYFEVYEDTIRRWGDKATMRYSWELFREMHYMRSPHIRLWLAHVQDEVVAGALMFYAKRHVVYWHGAALESSFHSRPVHLLMYSTIKHACESGYQWFDFNPSGGNEGVVAFKKGFAAKELPCPVIHTETAFTRLATKVAHLVQRYA